jgi:nuclear GTP-binding protein
MGRPTDSLQSIEQKAERLAASRAAARAPSPQGEEDETPGISSLSSRTSVLSRKGVLSGTSSLPEDMEEDDDEEENEIPVLVDTDLPTLQAALDKADVVCEVVDARDVLGGRSSRLEELVSEAGARVVLVVNKIGTSPPYPLWSKLTSQIWSHVKHSRHGSRRLPSPPSSSSPRTPPLPSPRRQKPRSPRSPLPPSNPP